MLHHGVNFVLPIGWQIFLFKVEREPLYSRNDWQQRAANLSRRVYLPAKRFAADSEAESFIDEFVVGTSDE